MLELPSPNLGSKQAVPPAHSLMAGHHTALQKCWRMMVPLPLAASQHRILMGPRTSYMMRYIAPCHNHFSETASWGQGVNLSPAAEKAGVGKAAMGHNPPSGEPAQHLQPDRPASSKQHTDTAATAMA